MYATFRSVIPTQHICIKHNGFLHDGLEIVAFPMPLSYHKTQMLRQTPLAQLAEGVLLGSAPVLPCGSISPCKFKNTSTGVAGGCHYAGIALCSSRTCQTHKYGLLSAQGLLLAARKRAG